MISPIKVLVRDVPPLIRDLLSHAFASAPDIELVEHRGPLHACDTLAPDVVVMTAADEAALVAVEEVLSQMSRPRVLVIRLHDHETVLYEWRLHGSELGDLSPLEIVAAIRAAVTQREN